MFQCSRRVGMLLVALAVFLFVPRTFDSIPAAATTATDDSGYEWRLRRAADFILSTQDEQGAMVESGYINTDSNMLYAIMGLTAAYDVTGDLRYLRGAEQGCRWLMQVQNPEGDWYLSYRKEKHQYLPTLPSSYEKFQAIRGVDTTMALFLYVADEVGRRTQYRDLAFHLKEAALRAYTFLVTHNLDSRDGLFWSSFQLEKGADGHPSDGLSVYRLYPVKYAADNAETFLGLKAASRLLGLKEAEERAERLKRSFSRFWDEDKRLYAVMLDKKGHTAMQPRYARHFATAWAAYLMRDARMFSLPLAVLAEEIRSDGSLRHWPWQKAYSLSGVSFLLAQCIDPVRDGRSSKVWEFLLRQQTPAGGIKDDTSTNNTYVNVTGMFLLLVSEMERQGIKWQAVNQK